MYTWIYIEIYRAATPPPTDHSGRSRGPGRGGDFYEYGYVYIILSTS